MTLTELLVIVVITLIVLVLLDGLRRNRKKRRNRVVMKLDRKTRKAAQDEAPSDDEDLYRAELPNGGARTLPRASDQIPRISKPAPRLKTAAAAMGRLQPQNVPVLRDEVELEEEEIEHTNVYADTSSTPAGESEDYESEDFVEEESAMGVYAEAVEERIEGLDEDFDDDVSSVRLRSRSQHGSDDDDDWEEEWDDEEDEEDEDEDEDEELWEEGWDDDIEAGNPETEEEDEEDPDEDEDVLDDEDEFEDDEFPSDFPEEDDEDVYNRTNSPVNRTRENPASSSTAQHHFQDGRIEPGFGDDSADTYEDEPGFEPAFSTDESHSGRSAGGTSEHKPVFGSGFLSKKDQGELFREEAAAAASPHTGPQEVIIINVMARPGSVFEGQKLLPVLQLQGMRLGDMSIFHKYSGSNASGTILFSMANMVKPGTFDLSAMDSFATPGVSFFLQLPNAFGNMASFEQMLAAATALKNSLDGELKDENRSVFTRQTMEHCRQRIRDFELKLLSHK